MSLRRLREQAVLRRGAQGMRVRFQGFRLLAAFLLAGPALAQDFEAVARRVLPASSEQVWQALDWQPTLWDGVIAAHGANKPVLLWAMNGHPLGHN